jgi:hypothetical protein
VNIHDALLAVREDVGAIGNTAYNEFHKFNYRGIKEVLNRVGPALLKQGVNVRPSRLISLESRDITTARGARNREVTVIVEYTYTAKDGSTFTAQAPGEAADAGASAVSKAMSVALRIAHIQALQIPTDEDDPAGSKMSRGTDPILKLKNEIWEEAERREWIGEEGDFTQLSDDFVLWTEGKGDIRTADEETLKKYRDHLKPPRKMQRKQPGGQS